MTGFPGQVFYNLYQLCIVNNWCGGSTRVRLGALTYTFHSAKRGIQTTNIE